MKFTKGEIIVPVESVYPTGALAVDGYGQDGSLLAHPLGGGLQLCFKPIAEGQFRVVPKSEQESPLWRRSRFEIEGVEAEFAGWTDGRLWNGWAMPYFEVAEAERVLKLLTDGQGRFDSEKDCFVTRNSDGEDEIWEGRQIPVVGGQQVRVYGVGAGAWIWDEVER